MSMFLILRQTAGTGMKGFEAFMPSIITGQGQCMQDAGVVYNKKSRFLWFMMYIKEFHGNGKE